jgi:hypothetical protein
MPRLRDFLETRMAELKTAGEPLLKRQHALRKELSQIEAELGSIQSEWQELQKANQAIGKSRKPEPTRASPSTLTIKDAILKVLEDHPTGLNATGILREINAKYFDGGIERTSFSPQMSRLKNHDRKVVQRGDLYFKKAEGPAFAEPS